MDIRLKHVSIFKRHLENIFCHKIEVLDVFVIVVSRPVARHGIEGGRDIFQAGPDMFVTLSNCFSNIF